ncbi:hypothetical protein [Cloacibacillus evryensis]|uniref:hypothetical protein n=1 Tax=Cloacibacillus evryensis TaxID=508460 RepID=UPI00241E5EDF|nr:hypothetical protein [Cloacibacillus evryensis]
MAKKTYKIPGFPKGYHMTWYVVTQAGYMTYVRLYDKSRTYLSGKSDVRAILPPLSYGESLIMGDDLMIEIDVPRSSFLDARIFSNIIRDYRGDPVGYSFVLCSEDGGDEDFNDCYVSLCAWKNKG